MTIGDIVNTITATPEIASDILVVLGQIGLWLKTIGVIILIWLMA